MPLLDIFVQQRRDILTLENASLYGLFIVLPLKLQTYNYKIH